MKRKIYSIVVSVTLIVGGLLCNTQSAKADLFGIVDAANSAETAALLAQQIAQFGQDFALGYENVSGFTSMMADIDKKVNDAQRIAQTLYKGKQTLDNINKVCQTMKKATSFARRCDSYKRYLENFGDNFNYLRVGYIVKNFNSRTMSLFNNAEDVFRSIAKLDNVSGKELFEAITKVSDELSDQIDAETEEAKAEIATAVQEAHFVKNAKANNQIQKKTII